MGGEVLVVWVFVGYCAFGRLISETWGGEGRGKGTYGMARATMHTPYTRISWIVLPDILGRTCYPRGGVEVFALVRLRRASSRFGSDRLDDKEEGGVGGLPWSVFSPCEGGSGEEATGGRFGRLR